MNAHVQERVDALDQAHFDEYALLAHNQLASSGHAFVVLTPGDGTRYEISIVQPHVLVRNTVNEIQHGTFIDRYFMATQFGSLYEWSPSNWNSWDYVCDKWVADGREWTGRVLARFLNALAAAIGDSA